MTSVERASHGRHTPPKGVISMPRDLSQTPAIARLGSTVNTPHIQACHVEQNMDDDHPLEHMIVTFEEDELTLETTGLLGKGGFGKVFAAKSSGGESYALKVSSKDMTESDWKRLNEEVSLMSHFSRHPNIVKFFAAGRDENRAYVLMERCAGRSLHDVIAYQSLEVPEMLWIGWSLVNTISYIHSKGCIHRDLKPQNLLFDWEGNLKITDFGLSSRISEAQPRKTVAGTAMYMAPEMAEEVYKRMTNNGKNPSLSYGKEVDTWSIGVVLYVLLTRMNPYLDAIEQKGVKQLSKEQKSLALFNAVADAAWCWPRGYSGDAQLTHLVERILDRNPSTRASLQDVLEDPVWNRRPLSCPLSLLQKLNLLERSPTAQPLNHLAENVPVAQKRSVEAVMQEARARVEATEARARSQLMLEHQEAFNVIANVLTLCRAEADLRVAVVQDEAEQWSRIQNLSWARRSGRARGGSVPLVSDAASSPSTGPRASRSVRSSVSLVDNEEGGRLVRSSPDQFAVVYPGRDTATRWSLRPVVSLPRDLTAEIEREYRCLNNHVMTKLTSMPHGYNGFDCNVCDRGILKITAEKPAYRCYKCDYDICMKCAFTGRFKEVNFVCMTCSKKFTSAAKLQAHSLRCRGPSESPSPRRSSRMNTLLWEEPKRPSLLEVQLPEDNEPKPRATRQSGRPTYVRTSTGGRISIGNPDTPTAEDVGGLVRPHQDADFPRLSTRPSTATTTTGRGGAKQGSQRRRSSSTPPSSESLSFDLPPRVRLPQRGEQPHGKVQPRSSAELRDLILEAERVAGRSSAKRPRIEPIPSEPPLKNSASPPKLNDQGNIIGIAARRRAESVDMVGAGPGVVTIRAEVAEKPVDKPRQGRVPRSASSSRNQSTPVSGPAQPQSISPAVPTSSSAAAPSPLRSKAPTRAPSVSGHTAQGGPPLPRRGGAAPPIVGKPPLPQIGVQLPGAIPPKNFATLRQPGPSMGNPMTAGLHSIAAGPARASPGMAAPRGPTPSRFGQSLTSAGGGGGGAYLALPREEHNRQQFLDDFLSGGWVRFYSFSNEDTVVMYYCLQPGRYGAMFPTEAGVGTAVVDIFSKLVLYVPCMNNESTNRSQPHPHVQTFYEEEARILSITEAQRYLGGVLKCIMSFVDEIARLRAEGLTPAAVHSAYIHHRNMSNVPRDTKFVYIRKVFPDPAGTFTLFRLSNLRSQVVCNAMVDIRWQSDRRHNVGQKYYVQADGTAEPFVVDHTGILSQVETVLNNSYRR